MAFPWYPVNIPVAYILLSLAGLEVLLYFGVIAGVSWCDCPFTNTNICPVT
jgi:hypothetical protein